MVDGCGQAFKLGQVAATSYFYSQTQLFEHAPRIGDNVMAPGARTPGELRRSLRDCSVGGSQVPASQGVSKAGAQPEASGPC